MNSDRGVFISFEGIDGAGKSSHIDALAEAFRAQGQTVVLTREPGGTPLAEKLRALVLYDAMDPLTEALLLFAARRDHVQQVILPALDRGEVVLCDRFTDASFAYQGSGRGFDLEVLLKLEQWVQQTRRPDHDFVLQPHLTLWFDLDPAVAAARLASARAPDRFEAEPGAFFSRVADGYRQRRDAAPERFVRIDADRPLASVRADVLAAVGARGWLR